jgi:histidinol-phosphate/aromatic aminotransferase/cobyric acid decarboxylase-like protein
MNCVKKPIGFPIFGSRSIEKFLKSSNDSDILILDSPSNPTGLRFSQTELEKLVSEKEKPVILDMALSEGAYNTSRLITDNSFIVKSFSKYFGLPGMRIGYVISAEENIQKLKSLVSPFEIDAVAQKAAKAALEDRNHILKSREHISSERKRIKSKLNQLSIEHSNSQSTNMVLKLPVETQEQLTKEGINITEGRDYKGLPSDTFRIGIRTEKKNQLLLHKIEELT